jgi:hypothetical protein
MKVLFAFILLLNFSCAFGQSFEYSPVSDNTYVHVNVPHISNVEAEKASVNDSGLILKDQFVAVQDSTRVEMDIPETVIKE